MEIQKAGNNSQQIQAKNVVIVQGIDEKRAREIYDEQYAIAKRDLTEEARVMAKERVKELEDKLIPKMQAIEDGLKAFADPSFQLLLIEAQKSAVATEREVDYDLLSELLIHRIERGDDRYVRTGIHRAVGIVEEISDEALLALTVVHSVLSFIPRATDVDSSLKSLEKLFEKIIYAELPLNSFWMDQLDVLSAIRINRLDAFESIERLYSKVLDGIVIVGIERNSAQHVKAEELLRSAELPVSNILENNPLNHDFVRLKVPSTKIIDSMKLAHYKNGQMVINPINEMQKNAINSVLNLYSKDAVLLKKVNELFIEKFAEYPYLVKLKEWWKKIPYGFDITLVGKVLAHANAQRCEKTLPMMDF